MDIKERIIYYLEKKRITPTKAESILSWSRGALLKPKSISADRIEEFLLYFQDLSSEWLFRGKGEMLLSASSSENTSSDNEEIERLKAELNQLKGENNIMREMLNLKKKEGERTKIA